MRRQQWESDRWWLLGTASLWGCKKRPQKLVSLWLNLVSFVWPSLRLERMVSLSGSEGLRYSGWGRNVGERELFEGEQFEKSCVYMTGTPVFDDFNWRWWHLIWTYQDFSTARLTVKSQFITLHDCLLSLCFIEGLFYSLWAHLPPVILLIELSLTSILVMQRWCVRAMARDCVVVIGNCPWWCKDGRVAISLRTWRFQSDNWRTNKCSIVQSRK